MVRVQMRMSFDDEQSFKEAVESLRFNTSDPNTRQQMRSSNSVPLQDSERNKDNTIPSDPITVGSSSSLNIREIRRSGDIQVSFYNLSLASNPELEFISANGI